MQAELLFFQVWVRAEPRSRRRWHNLLDRHLPSSPQYEAPPRVLDALRASRVRREYGGAQTSPLVDLGHRRADRRTDDGTPTAAHPRTSTISSSADDNSDGQGGLGLLIAADANDRAAVTDLPLPSPRSPTETLVIDFLVAFFLVLRLTARSFAAIVCRRPPGG